tara:strand:- start:1081 stop:2064 length:984 start_codon:yes stop_codon:yes gene_type:complete
MMIDNKIIFIKSYNFAQKEVAKTTTDYLRGELIGKCLRKNHDYSNVIILDYNSLLQLYANKITNSIIFFVRLASLDQMKKLDNYISILKSNNNYVIHDVCDFWNMCENNTNTHMELSRENIMNCVIVSSSEYMKQYIKKYTKAKVVKILHQSDSRINKVDNVNLQIQYLGSVEKLHLSKKLVERLNINIRTFGEGLKSSGFEYYKKAERSIHISYIKKENTMYYHFCDTGKIYTALASNSIIICTKVPCYVELLGDDYEFFIKNGETEEEIFKNITNVYNKAKLVLNNEKKLFSYIKKYSKILEMLNLNNVVKKYDKLIKNIYLNRT